MIFIAKFSLAIKQNAKMKRNGREKCEIFVKRFFLFAGNLNINLFTKKFVNSMHANNILYKIRIFFKHLNKNLL